MESICEAVLGLIFLLQVTSVPGIIYHFAVNKRIPNGIADYSSVFGLSGFFNILIAQLLVGIGKFDAQAIMIIFLVEFIAILSLGFSGPRLITPLINSVKKISESRLNLPIVDGRLDFVISIDCFTLILMVPVLAIFLISGYRATEPMVTGDLATYIGWARSAFKGLLPYPQDYISYPLGVPLIWAYEYIILGGDAVNLFNKIYLSIFPVIIPSIGVYQWIATRQRLYLLFSCLYSILLISYTPNQIAEWSMDLPCATVGYLTYLVYRESSNKPDSLNISKTFTILAMASFSALLKQSGLVVIGASVGWVLYAASIAKVSKASKLMIFIIIALAIAPAAYSYFSYIYYIHTGQASSSSEWLTIGIHEGRGAIERVTHSLGLLMGAISRIPAFLILLSGFLYGFKIYPKSNVIWVLTVGYIIYWSLMYSYERRTLSLIFPFCALFSVSLFEWMFNHADSKFRSFFSILNRQILRRKILEIEIKGYSPWSIFSLILVVALSTSIMLLLAKDKLSYSSMAETERLRYLSGRGNSALNKIILEIKPTIGDGIALTQYGIDSELFNIESIDIRQKSASYLNTLLLRSDARALIVERSDAYGYMDDQERTNLLGCLQHSGRINLLHSISSYSIYSILSPERLSEQCYNPRQQ